MKNCIKIKCYWSYRNWKYKEIIKTEICDWNKLWFLCTSKGEYFDAGFSSLNELLNFHGIEKEKIVLS